VVVEVRLWLVVVVVVDVVVTNTGLAGSVEFREVCTTAYTMMINTRTPATPAAPTAAGCSYHWGSSSPPVTGTDLRLPRLSPSGRRRSPD
jgi:hypothetical protein